jgi:hypothetical protein
VDAGHAFGVLRRQRGDDGRAKNAKGGKGLEVGLNPAPPPESDPAIVSAIGMFMVFPSFDQTSSYSRL